MSGGGGGERAAASQKKEAFGKVPGRDSGVTASDIAAGNVGEMQPKKRDVVQTYTVGVASIDNGAMCDGKGDSVPGCFLSDAQRARLIRDLSRDLTVAQTNYKLALIELKFDKLIEKDDDVPWVVDLALSLVSAHLATVVAKSLNNLKNSTISRLEDVGLDAARRDGFDENSEAQKVSEALRMVSDKSIETAAKTGFDTGKRKASKGTQAALNKTEKSDKAQTIAYIDQLQNECDVAFKQFFERTTGTVNDAELVVIYRGFSPELHSIAEYKAALAEKIARFKQSGVTEIGQKQVGPFESHVATLYANRRCAWLLNADGSKALWFYTMLSSNQTEPWTHGSAPDIERVPDEFVDAAVAKSEEKWGATPTFEHPAVSLMRRMSVHERSQTSPANVAPRVANAPIPTLHLRDPSRRGRP